MFLKYSNPAMNASRRLDRPNQRTFHSAEAWYHARLRSRVAGGPESKAYPFLYVRISKMDQEPRRSVRMFLFALTLPIPVRAGAPGCPNE